MGAFIGEVRAGLDQMRKEMEDGVRLFYLELFTMIVMKSPVGNPRNWKINQHQRAAHEEAAEINAIRRKSSMYSYTNKKGQRRMRPGMKLTAATVRPAIVSGKYGPTRKGTRLLRRGGDMYRAPKGYMGGRFRANWQFTLDAPAQNALEAIDPTGQIAIDTLMSVVSGMDLTTSKVAYFVNNLEYATAIEFGVPGKSPLYPVWSKQAPHGVVQTSLVNAQRIWNRIFGS